MHFSLLGLLALFYLLAFYFGWRFLNNAKLQSLSAHRWVLGFAVISHCIFSVSELLVNFSYQIFGVKSSWLLTTAVVGLVIWVLAIQKRAMTLVVWSTPLVAAALVLPYFFFQKPPTEHIDLPSSWLWTHISMMIMGEVFLFFCAMVAGLYLVSDRQLKRKKNLKLLFNLPSLSRQEQLLHRLLWMGFCFLSLGMLLGLFFAGQLWQGEWWLNPSIVIASLSWLFYLLLILLYQFFKGSRPRLYSWAVILVFGFIFLSSLLVSSGSIEPHYKWEKQEQESPQ